MMIYCIYAQLHISRDCLCLSLHLNIFRDSYRIRQKNKLGRGNLGLGGGGGGVLLIFLLESINSVWGRKCLLGGDFLSSV